MKMQKIDGGFQEIHAGQEIVISDPKRWAWEGRVNPDGRTADVRHRGRVLNNAALDSNAWRLIEGASK